MINTDFIIYVAVAILLIAMFLNMLRFIKGPTLVDKIIAFDVLSISGLVLIGILAILSNRMIYIDVAIVYGLLSFMGVIVVAKYIQKGL
ncbi:MAG TPA: cation:proton antiporter [Bacteroidales bacterium]|nr:MAG: cation:proton antiporter [Bacteroidetes bacterium GWF2_33_38]HBF87228.1 cation:proton antiporter [Bacteroidales bacterium]